jgi:Ca-activated chloride channel family protein
VSSAIGLLTLTGVALVALAAARRHLDIQRWLGADPFARLRSARALLLAAALIAAAVALFHASSEPPRLGGASADVVLLLDTSRSMDASDTPPSRLRRAVRFAERFVEEAEGVRLGLVVSAGAAFPVVPLTQDRDALLTYLAGVDTELISKPGTDLGRALRTALEVFDPTSSRPRTLLLLSDGEHAGSDLGAALADLRAGGVRVTAVGFGTPTGGIVPGRGMDPVRDRHGRAVRSRRTDAILERIARSTGGTFQLGAEAPPDPRSLTSVPEARAQDEEERAAEPLRPWVLFAALVLAIEILLSSPGGRRRRGRIAAALSTAAVALLLTAPGPASWLRSGDAHLERGETRAALSLYRRVERTRGQSGASRIRVGNALYRLDQLGPASAAFLDALQELGPTDRDDRFVAAFNLGTALLAQQRYREARDALWTALLAQPERLEAKFNYEWAVEQIPPEEDEPARASKLDPEGEADEQDREGPAPTPRDPSVRAERERKRTPLTKNEAERWLRAIDENPIEPLRQQIAERLEPSGKRGPGGQTW